MNPSLNKEKADMIEEAEKRYPLDSDFTRNELLNVNAVREGYRKAYIAGATSSSTVKELEREVERLKGLIEVAFKSDGSWDKFKTENNL